MNQRILVMDEQLTRGGGQMQATEGSAASALAPLLEWAAAGYRSCVLNAVQSANNSFR